MCINIENNTATAMCYKNLEKQVKIKNCLTVKDIDKVNKIQQQ